MSLPIKPVQNQKPAQPIQKTSPNKEKKPFEEPVNKKLTQPLKDTSWTEFNPNKPLHVEKLTQQASPTQKDECSPDGGGGCQPSQGCSPNGVCTPEGYACQPDR